MSELDTSQEMGGAADERATGALQNKRRVTIALVSAVLIAALFMYQTVVRGRYDKCPPTFVALELGVAVVSALMSCMVTRMDEYGRRWADRAAYAEDGSWRAIAYRVLAVMPSVVVRAVIICACLAAVNATVVASVIFGDKILFAPVAVLVRFLGDIPQALLICFIVEMVLRRDL